MRSTPSVKPATAGDTPAAVEGGSRVDDRRPHGRRRKRRRAPTAASAGSPAAEPHPEPGQRPAEERRQRPLRAPEPGRGLAPRQPLQVAQHHRHAVSLGQREQRRVEVEASAPRFRLRGGNARVPSGRRRRPGGGSRGPRSGRSAPRPCAATGRAARRAAVPAARRTSTRNVAWNASSASWVLAQPAAADAPDDRPVPADEFGERGLVALREEAVEQLPVGRPRPRRADRGGSRRTRFMPP